MRSPKLFLSIFGLLLTLAASQAAAQSAETFNFPQNHDTTFGDQLGIPPLGNFDWWLEGHGVHGRRQTTNIDKLTAFGFNLVFGPSCFGDGTNMTLDVYVNDRLIGSRPMPNQSGFCNFVPTPIQADFDLSANPIPALTGGREFDIRFQIRGTIVFLNNLFIFYRIDTNTSQIALAGTTTDDDDDENPPPPPPPPPDDDSDVLNRIDGAESNIKTHVTGEANTTRSAVQSVRDALGIVEGNLDASIAGAVLQVNAETALGISNLAAQLGVQGQDLAAAIKGNGNAIEKVQQSITDKLLPEVLKANQGIAITQESVKKVGDNFLEQMLATGTGVLSMWSGGALLPVASFVQKSIMSVVNGALRPDRIFKKAMAEFNRGLKRVKKLFSMNGPAFSLPWDRAAVEAITFGFAAEAGVDIPDFPVENAYDLLLGPDTEEDNAYGAFIWFSRAYQTLVNPDGYGWHDGHLHRGGECLDPRHSKAGAKARLTAWP